VTSSRCRVEIQLCNDEVLGRFVQGGVDRMWGVLVHMASSMRRRVGTTIERHLYSSVSAQRLTGPATTFGACNGSPRPCSFLHWV
jgi:hypothetical protein